MRDFGLLWVPRRWSEANEQTTIYGGAEDRDPARGGAAWRDGKRGVPAPWLAPPVLYRWRAVAQGGSAVVLKRDAQRKPRKDDAETRHKAEIERMRAVCHATEAFAQVEGGRRVGAESSPGRRRVARLHSPDYH